MTTLTIEQRVTAGAAWLDRTMPDWLDVVDLGQLDLSDECNCVLGQLVCSFDLDDEPSYMQVAKSWFEEQSRPSIAAMDRLGLNRVLTMDEAADKGFHITREEETSDWVWDELTAAWRDLILGRRGERDL